MYRNIYKNNGFTQATSVMFKSRNFRNLYCALLKVKTIIMFLYNSILLPLIKTVFECYVPRQVGAVHDNTSHFHEHNNGNNGAV